MDSFHTTANPDDYPQSWVPVEKIPHTTRVLWLVGLGDENFPSEEHAERAIKMRESLPADKQGNLQVNNL